MEPSETTQQPAAPQPPQQYTPPAPKPPIDDRIANFAQGFLADVEKNDDPDGFERADEVEAPQEEAPVEEQTQEQEPQPEAEQAIPEPAEPVIEFELEDGKKLQVPEALKPHLMRDKDYRQKTMALAEQRKTLEQLTTQAQQVATQSQQMAPYFAQLYAMDTRADQIQRALTSELMTNDPVEFNRAQGELAILLRNRDQLAAWTNQAESHLKAQQAEILEKKLAVDAPKLFEEIPELAKPESRQELAKYLRGQGLSDVELLHVNYSTTAAKLAWKAKQYDQMVKDNVKAAEKLKQQVKTLPPVAPNSRAPVDTRAQQDKLRKQWRKEGGKHTSEAFDQMLAARLRGK